jgi:nucleoid DNA-binding protein
VTKTDIVEQVQNATGMSKKEAYEAVECFFDTLKGILEAGEAVKIPKFGNFEVKAKAARRGRNPQTATKSPSSPVRC